MPLVAFGFIIAAIVIGVIIVLPMLAALVELAVVTAAWKITKNTPKNKMLNSLRNFFSNFNKNKSKPEKNSDSVGKSEKSEETKLQGNNLGGSPGAKLSTAKPFTPMHSGLKAADDNDSAGAYSPTVSAQRQKLKGL